jgi:hypothetical protein
MDVNKPTQTQTDVSPRVHELMQRLDRLPPGTYQLIIVKDDIRAMDWSGEILNVQKIERFSVSKSGSYNSE